MSELRKDPVTGRWVIIASERENRPGALPADFPDEYPTHGDRCPFCEGNEDMTPNEVLAFRDRNSQRNKPGWWVRVVPNKYPAMRIEGPTLRVGEGDEMISGLARLARSVRV